MECASSKTATDVQRLVKRGRQSAGAGSPTVTAAKLLCVRIAVKVI